MTISHYCFTHYPQGTHVEEMFPTNQEYLILGEKGAQDSSPFVKT